MGAVGLERNGVLPDFGLELRERCRERDRVTALQQAAERRKHEDAAADRAAADDVRRLHAEMARRERNEEERLRAAEEHMRGLEDAIKRNKKPKAAK